MPDNDLSKTLIQGLQIAERRMLEQKATRKEEVVIKTPDGKIKKVSARTILKRQSK